MEWFIRLVIIGELIVRYAISPYYWLVNRRPKEVISAAKNPILELSAVVISEKIRRKEITSEAVVSAYIERIKEVNPQLNAVVEDRFEAAIEDARACDEKLATGEVTAKQLEVEQPLFGVPITVKETCSVNGLSHTAGAVARAGMKATCDSMAVGSLKTSGAIPLCVTNTPEMCLAFEGYNKLHGTTNNPYDTRRTSGGSSSGEGALLGCSASLIGIGSDLAGSIRVPALYCGVFGHKPTPGFISLEGHMPYSNDPDMRRYFVIGPLARYAEDLELAFRAMVKEKGAPLNLDTPVDVKSLRVLYQEEIQKSVGLIPVDENIKRVIKKAAVYLRVIGADVSEANIEGFNDSLHTTLGTLSSVKDMPQMLLNTKDPNHESNSIAELAKSVFGSSRHTTSAIFFTILKDVFHLVPRSKMSKCCQETDKLAQALEDLLRNDGVLLFPSFVNSATFHGQLNLQHAASIYTAIFNILGFPATQVPMGFDAEGLPVGLQVVAAPMQDRLCLAVAKELERGFGGWTPPSAKA